jgi:hypothetical protein
MVSDGEESNILGGVNELRGYLVDAFIIVCEGNLLLG